MYWVVLVIGVLLVATSIWLFNYVGHGGLGLVVGCLAILVLTFSALAILLRAECERIGIQVERPTEFYVIGGCFVTLDNGRSVPIDEDSLGLFLETLDD